MLESILHKRTPQSQSRSKVDPRFWSRSSHSINARTSSRSKGEDRSRYEVGKGRKDGNSYQENMTSLASPKLSLKRSNSAKQLISGLNAHPLRQTSSSARSLNAKVAVMNKDEALEVVANYVYDVPEKKMKGRLHGTSYDDSDEQEEEGDEVTFEARPLISEDEDEIAYFSNRMGGSDFKLLRRHVLHPHGRIRSIWDTITLVLTTWVLVIVPFELTFAMRYPLRRAILQLDLCIDTLFLVDIILNFITAVEDDGKLHFSFFSIVRHYSRGWFLPELLWTIPFYAIFERHDPQPFNSQGSAMYSLSNFSTQAAYLYPAARCLRLLRVLGLPRLQHRLEHSLLISSKVSSLGSFLYVVLALSHVFSCVFAYLAFHYDEQLEFALNSRVLQDSEVKTRYIAAFYWSMMTMTTVGYGDIKTNAGRLFSIAAMIVGAGVFAYGITNVVSLFQQLYESDTAYRRDMDQINDFMQARMLPRALRDKVRANTFHWRKAARGENKERDRLIVERMARLIRAKVADHFCEDIMPHKMPFLAGCSSEFIHDLYLRMHVQCYLPGEDIICQGDYGSEMFFLFVGHAQVLVDLTKVALFGPNSCFGEFSIANPRKPRLATIQALDFCETHCIDREQILRVLLLHPMTLRSARQLTTLRSRKALTLISESGGKSRTLLQGLAMMWRAEGVEALLPVGVTVASLPFLQEFMTGPTLARSNSVVNLVPSNDLNAQLQLHSNHTQLQNDALSMKLPPSFSKSTNSDASRRLSVATDFLTAPHVLRRSPSLHRRRSELNQVSNMSSEVTTFDRALDMNETSDIEVGYSNTIKASTKDAGVINNNSFVSEFSASTLKLDDRYEVLLTEIRNVARRQDLLEQQLKLMIERQHYVSDS
ncbi:voltage-gated ion channel superfamily [Plasmopara halstedii]|uniref:Voltage-gated ion channel superfamily n=1 Tax=Plasmopara halstedii TaxID=4781 RepID=A0A0P1ALW2_PLAHL|nr:voltage-gated ion channel superfamily [Plasmopara halstedii]CEG41734.1 voltage-gated ion channel superfamily [Plasmopara halstedii]|eukprot:XP_024578103.1 voltage-gated ion channel superfamily [Plasmopara halstedii]